MQKIIKTAMESSAIASLPFVNSVITYGLPIDESTAKKKPRQVKGCNYSRAEPTPLIEPTTIAVSEPCVKWIKGLDSIIETD